MNASGPVAFAKADGQRNTSQKERNRGEADFEGAKQPKEVTSVYQTGGQSCPEA